MNRERSQPIELTALIARAGMGVMVIVFVAAYVVGPWWGATAAGVSFVLFAYLAATEGKDEIEREGGQDAAGSFALFAAATERGDEDGQTNA